MAKNKPESVKRIDIASKTPDTRNFYSFFFDVLSYVARWYLEKEEADKINRKIVEHRKKSKGKS